jgi:UDP-glucuronate 4-epimerase
MNVLVTGAAGFIGSHLAERLAALGHAVRAVDCLTDYYSRSLKMLNVHHIQARGVVFRAFDLAEDDLQPAVQDVDFIFHLAAQPGISTTTPFDTYVRNNLLATHRLVQAALSSPALRGLIYISTSSVYGRLATGDETTQARPISHYGVTKLAAEQLVLASTRDRGFPACSLRLFSVYGPRERPEKLFPRLIQSILSRQPFPLREGSQHHRRSYTYVDDAIDGLVAALDHFDRCRGEIVNIGNDTATTTAQGIRIVEEIIGQSAQLVVKARQPGDQRQHRKGTRAAELSSRHDAPARPDPTSRMVQAAHPRQDRFLAARTPCQPTMSVTSDHLSLHENASLDQ